MKSTQKILLALAIIVAVGGGVAASTGAFFSDTETSTGNTFTAGSIDLTVDSTQHYNNAVCTDGTWHLVGETPAVDQYPVIGTACDGTFAATSLGASTHFFNFGDVKPADQGEDTVSLHIDNNPAYACLDIKTTANDENTLIAPEVAAGDVTAGPTGGGELAQNIQVFTWLDNGAGNGTAGDNIWQAGEPALAGPVALSALGATTTLALADPSINGGVPLAPGATNYVGMQWCAGTMTASAGVITCNGATMGNDAQTDSATADVAFRVIQARNNSAFRCNTATVVTANNLSTTGADANWYFFDDTNNVINNALGSFVAGPATPPAGTGSAQATLADGTSRTFLANGSFGGTVLSNISAWSFGEYSHSGSGVSATEVPFIRFNVDFTTGSPTFQKSLVYEPNDNGVVTQDTWQNWDLINGGNAKWEYSGSFWPAGVTTVANTVPGTTARTWTSILADYPSIRMWAAGPQVGMRVGEPGPAGYIANLDNFSITISGVTKTYDFGG